MRYIIHVVTDQEINYVNPTSIAIAAVIFTMFISFNKNTMFHTKCMHKLYTIYDVSEF